jgi:hypothetical protein
MKTQFESAINPSPLMKLSRLDVAEMIKLYRSGRAMGILRKTADGYSVNARLVWKKLK